MNRSHRDMDKPYTNIRVIVNPASGTGKSILNVLNNAFNHSKFYWELAITKEEGDGTRLAREAVDQGSDLVVAYGGDGTVMETASGLMGNNVPLGILPGGTGNVMSVELGIPRDLEAAINLLLHPNHQVRMIDIAQHDNRCFLLRIGVGLEAEIIEGAARAQKDKFGIFAYIMSGIQALNDPKIARYKITIDGKEYEHEGMVCMIANTGNLGVPGLNLAPGIDVSDGLLDVVVIRKGDLGSILSLTANVLGGTENPQNMIHLKASKVISVESDPPQSVQGDGELVGTSPIEVKVLPHSLGVVVPRSR